MCNEHHDNEQLHKIRHSLSHIMAQAVQRVQQADVEIAIWPAIANGFYYDFLFSAEKQIKDEDLPNINEMMVKIVKEGQIFTRLDTTNEESEYIVEKVLKQQYKAELRNEFAAAGEGISFYLNSIPVSAKDALLKGVKEDYVKYYEGVTKYFQEKHPKEFADRFVTFLDMCEGPHVESMKEIDSNAFKVAKLAGAYWRGDEKNVMMTRLYAYAFETKEELKQYLELLEEAKKRDHRILGEKMEIFTFDDEVWPGLPLWLPNGAIIVEEIENLAKETEERYGYLRVRSPHIAKDKLYLRSGHLPYYAESMFPPMEMDGETYYLKAMNCPHHHKIFGAVPKSYRDMPQRYAEYGHCYRYEDSGALFGLMRVRSLCMNDAHIYCTEEQFEEEFAKVVEMYLYYFEIFGIKDYKMRLSKHSKEGLGKKYVDNEALWIATEDKVRQVLIKLKVPYFEAEDEAAFYGPKIDVQIWSVIGREFSLATNQLDFAVPERFNLTYTDKDGKEKTPLCIHRAPLSTHERFVGFLLEHFAGAFPLWLAPEQVRIIPVADAFLPYAEKVEQELKSQHFRVSIDTDSNSFSKKIRNAEVQKVPYILIIGEKEEKAESVAVREFKTKEQYEMGVKEFVEKVKVIRDEKRL